MKKLIIAAAYGAATAIGYTIAKNVVDKLSNPVNRAKIKRVINTAKHEFSNKTES